MTTKWYATKGSGGQGIVIEETTGRTVAVAYDKKDTALLAAAPEMAEALRAIVAGGVTGWSLANHRAARAALAKAGAT